LVDELAIGAAFDLGHQKCHDFAHLLFRAHAAFGDALLDQGFNLGLGQLLDMGTDNGFASKQSLLSFGLFLSLGVFKSWRP
jgi:hypothetical protein